MHGIIPSFFTFITVGYDISYYNYSWLRDPHLNTNVHLDNHDVRISKFVFTTSRDNLVYPGLGVKVRLKRHFGYHLTQTYIPSIIFVVVAWVSFHVPSDVVPGRMVLCVTTLLTLTAMFNSVRYVKYRSVFPPLKCIMGIMYKYENTISPLLQEHYTSCILHEGCGLMGICLPTVCLLNSSRVRIHLASHQPECLAKENRYFQEVVKLYSTVLCKEIQSSSILGRIKNNCRLCNFCP